MRELAYLASPYSHPDADERGRRFDAVCDAAAFLMGRGYLVYSPIAHSHPIAVRHNLPLDYGFWQELDERMLECCDLLIVLCYAGWLQSHGIEKEIARAESMKLPISYLQGTELYEFAP